MLHDYLQCELALQESKLRLVTVLLDVLQHSTEASERQENMQLLIDTIHARSPVNLGSVFVSSTYKLNVDTLNARAELLSKVLEHQRNAEQRYTSEIYRQTCPHDTLPGFTLPCVPPLHLPNTLSNATLSFRLFPSPPPPPPPPPPPREVLCDAPPYVPPHVPQPALPVLSLTHARIEVLPSLGAAPQLLQICRELAEQKAQCLAAPDAGIIWLAFEYAFLSEALLLVEARRRREYLGDSYDCPPPPVPSPASNLPRALSDSSLFCEETKAREHRFKLRMATVGDYVAMYPTLDRCIVEELVSALSKQEDILQQLDEMQQFAIHQEEDKSAAAEEERKLECMDAGYLAPPILQSCADNPLALDNILDTLRVKEKTSLPPSLSSMKGQEMALRGVVRTLELLHRRWLLATTLWEVDVLERATAKWTRDYKLQEAAGNTPAQKPAMPPPTDKDDDTEVPPVYFRLGHHVDSLELPLLRLVGLKERDLEIDFQGVQGVSALLEHPAAPKSRSGEAAEKLGHVLQLARLRKHMLAVAVEYNDAHLDALLLLHNMRVEQQAAQDQVVTQVPHPSPDAPFSDGDYELQMDGSVAPKKKKAPTAISSDEWSTDDEKSSKRPKMPARPGNLQPPRWPLLRLLPPYQERLELAMVMAEGIQRLAESVATIPYAAPLAEKVERITATICAELALPSLTVQGVQEVTRLRAFWQCNPEVRVILHSGPRVQKAQGQMGPVLVELKAGAVSINIWRVPLAAEFFSDMCLDRAALAQYVTAVRALYDTLCFFKARALCAGEPAAAVSEQLRRDATRLRDR